MKRIEFGELRIGDIARKHIQDCLDRNWISMGPKVEQLEQEFAALMGCKYGVALSSGTAAITAMTLSLPEIAKRKVVIGKSKVICPALAFIANSTGIVSGRLIPKWVDINPYTLNIDDYRVEQAIDDDVVAIYAVGTMGRPSEMAKLREIADRYDLILFEDGCENYGSKIHGKFSHDYAIAGCSSFFQAHLVQAGEGSVVYTNDENLRDLLVSIRSHGRPGKSAYFNHVRFGSNFKMTDLCACVGLEGVAQFHENISARKVVWNELVNFTSQYKDIAYFSSSEDYMEVMPHGFSITLKSKYYDQFNRLVSMLDRNEIHWKRNFGFCGHHNSLASYFEDKDGYKFSNAIYCGTYGLHIGCHRYITSEDLDRIKSTLKQFFDSYL